MIDYRELKSIVLFNDLSDDMLKKLAEVARKGNYREHDYLFHQNEEANKLYAVITGEIELGITVDKYQTVRMEIIKPGGIFGFSALINSEEKYYTAYGKAVQDTSVFEWDAKDLDALLKSDYELGYLFMKKIALIAKNRLQIRNASLLDIYNRK